MDMATDPSTLLPLREHIVIRAARFAVDEDAPDYPGDTIESTVMAARVRVSRDELALLYFDGVDYREVSFCLDALDAMTGGALRSGPTP
jgi:hypothetical protein